MAGRAPRAPPPRSPRMSLPVRRLRGEGRDGPVQGFRRPSQEHLMTLERREAGRVKPVLPGPRTAARRRGGGRAELARGRVASSSVGEPFSRYLLDPAGAPGVLSKADAARPLRTCPDRGWSVMVCVQACALLGFGGPRSHYCRWRFGPRRLSSGGGGGRRTRVTAASGANTRCGVAHRSVRDRRARRATRLCSRRPARRPPQRTAGASALR